MLVKSVVMLGVVLTSLSYADVDNGKVLYNEGSCLECHSSSDFANEAKKIKMFKDIESRVQACQLANDDGFFDDEVHDVAKYLNKEYYKLQK